MICEADDAGTDFSFTGLRVTDWGGFGGRSRWWFNNQANFLVVLLLAL